MSGPWASAVVVLALVVALLAIAMFVLTRRVAGVLTRVEAWLTAPELRPPGLQPGARVQAFSALRQDGRPLRDADLRGDAHIVLFMKSDCVACRALARQLSRSALDGLGIGRRTYVVVRDERERDQLGLDRDLEIVFQDDGVIAWAFRSSATPQAFVVDDGGLVTATGFPNAIDHLADLYHTGALRQLEMA